MSIEAHKCNEKACKGFIVFENADFDLLNPETVDGMYQFDDPHCTECGKEYKVVPHYAVIAIDEDGMPDFDVDSACMIAYQRRENERSFEQEEDPYVKVKKYIRLMRYSYDVEDVKTGYLNREQYLSHTMQDCIERLGPELEKLTKTY